MAYTVMRSNGPSGLSGETNLEDQSACSSDTGDVLTRSTRVFLPDLTDGSGSPPSNTVQITVQPPLAEQQQTSRMEKQKRPQHREKPEIALPPRAAADSHPEGSRVKSRDRRMAKPPRKENRDPTGSDPGGDGLEIPARRLSGHPLASEDQGHDLLTSRYAAGGKGAVLAALKQRSQSAPQRREVKVQFLAPGLVQGPTSPVGLVSTSQGQPGLQPDPRLSSGQLGDAASTAAVVAAAIAATAPLIQAQSNMEARVSQLADGVKRLLEANREAGGRRSSQHTLHSLETIHHQQLQLQSQLLGSALSMVTPMTSGPAVTPDLSVLGDPVQSNRQRASLHITHLDSEEALTGSRRSRLETPTPRQMPPWPSSASSSWVQPGTARPPTSRSRSTRQGHSRLLEVVLSNQRSSATGSATMGTESVAIATPPHDHQPEQTRDDHLHRGAPTISTATQMVTGSPSQASANHNQAATRRANEVLREMGRLKTEMQTLLTPEDTKTTNSQPQQPLPQTQTQTQTQSESQSQSQSQSLLLQRRPVVPSMLEEAGRVLHRVQRERKVLEENLEALLRAKTGEVLHCQLEALSANRDWREEVRVKKTVNAWINALTEDIQAEMATEDVVKSKAKDTPTRNISESKDAAVVLQQRSGGSRNTARTRQVKGRPLSMPSAPGSKMAVTGSRGQTDRTGGQTAGYRANQSREPGDGGRGGEREMDGELYLMHLYGRALYEGHRRTLKKSPYLRFSSPASKTRTARPQLVESIRGVKMKSCKTQTSLAPPTTPPLYPSPHQSPHYILSSSHVTSVDPGDLPMTPVECFPVPMAIPLGRPRVDSSRFLPTEHPEEVTRPPPTSNMDAIEVRPAEPQIIDTLIMREEPIRGLSFRTVDIADRKEEDKEEDDVLPGTDLLAVADVVQEEVSVVVDDAIELAGHPSPLPVIYQGPAFPPQAGAPLPVQEQASVLGLVQQREALETRLVDWVEQQLMSRMISEMYRLPPSDPAQNDSTDESEPEERSITSDIVEAAVGGGLQLFVDANVSVDSALIRQLVNEVLAETVALMLGQRDALEPVQRPVLGPVLPTHQEERLVPTPVPSPTMPSPEASSLATPPPSDPPSLENTESPQPATATELVVTPTSTPDPAHSRVSLTALHPALPPLPWGDAELPLAEERPEHDLDTHKKTLWMSVAEEEPPLSSPPPPPQPRCSLTPPPQPNARPLSPASPSPSSTQDSSTNSSSTSTSSTVTVETDTAVKHISEGELLLSSNQLAAMAALEEEGFSFPGINSFSSSLQEFQDMDFDPPSEGQVKGHTPTRHNPLLTLLVKMDQGVTHTHTQPRSQPEGSWVEGEEEVSVGEVREGLLQPRERTTNLHRTTNTSRTSTAARQGQTCPGQTSQPEDVTEVNFEATNQGPVTMGDLEVEPIRTATLTSDPQTDQSLSPPPLEDTHTAAQAEFGLRPPIMVRQYDGREPAGQEEQGGSRRMDIRLPSIRLEEEEEEEVEVIGEESVSLAGAVDTDSSANDVF